MRVKQAVVAFAISAITAAAGAGTGEYWEVKQTMSMEGMSLPPSQTKVCKPTRPAAEDMLPADRDSNCQMTNVRTSGAKLTYEIACSGPDAVTGSGEVEQLGPDAYRGRNVMRSKDGEMTMEFEGRKVGGACDPGEPLRKFEAMMAQGQADACRRLGSELAPPDPPAGMPPEALPGCRTTHKAAYCEGVRAGQDVMAERSKFSSMSKATGWREAFGFCGLDAAALERKMCQAAIDEEDYSFVADSCVEDAKAIAARCAGRDITSLSKAGQMQIRPICEKYGPGADPAAAAAAEAAPAPAPEAPPPEPPSTFDKLKKGTKGLKDLIKLP
ncbi:MAG: hypothetical protein H6R27_1442 [Proteobacteria bacterium]|nr:hypothetical protein [Pseudomonadota bacterium]